MVPRTLFLLGLLLAACQAAPLDSVYDFVTANRDVLEVTLDILQKADLQDFFSDPETNGTFLICPDEVILTTLSANLNSFANGSSVAQVVSGVQASSVRTAARFLEDSTLGKTYPTITSLAKAGPIKTLSGITFQAQYDQLSGVYVTVGSDPDIVDYSGYIQGPVAIPVGNAVVYITDTCLADPTVFVGGSQTR
ncbi:hypothetical protein N2152v2_010893 [Parachlorella kessleri]